MAINPEFFNPQYLPVLGFMGACLPIFAKVVVSYLEGTYTSVGATESANLFAPSIIDTEKGRKLITVPSGQRSMLTFVKGPQIICTAFIDDYGNEGANITLSPLSSRVDYEIQDLRVNNSHITNADTGLTF